MAKLLALALAFTAFVAFCTAHTTIVTTTIEETNPRSQQDQQQCRQIKYCNTNSTNWTPTPEELFAALLPELREKGVFDMTVNVQSSKQKFAVKTSWYSSVESFKLLVEEKFKIPVVRQCLIYEGRILEDNRTLASYGLVAGKNVHLIVLGGPFQDQEANPRTANHRIARLAEYSLHSGASPAHIIQSMYDSDPFYREMMKSPALFRRFCSGTPMTEEEMLAIHLSLQWGVRQQQSTG
ncbi:uncharacterized protein [Rutidosis leptorrhynchoides]|uniref:uncharacterized protein n=1 Tax=Rutidosis leptorrhynchoides TaxID=125765 RepID=UPI003A9A1FAD